MNAPKQIKTSLDALSFFKKHQYHRSLDDDELNNINYIQFIKWLRNFEEKNQDITIGNLATASEEFGCTIKTDDFRNLGDGGKTYSRDL